MQAFLLVVTIALTGPVADADGTRYGREAAPSDNAIPGNLALEQKQLPPQSVLPQQPPSQASPILPADSPAADYRAPEHLQGQQSPLSQPVGSVHSDTLPLRTAPSAKKTPAQLIRSLLQPPAKDQLAGLPLSLANTVQGASSRSEQTRRVEAYWDLSAALADYYLARRDATDLQVLRQGVLQASAQWEEVRQMLDQRGQVAHRSALAAQARLQRMLGRSANGTLPLPADLPHCGAYDTRYDQIFGGRLPSPEAQRYHELLPLEHQSLRRQAVNVAVAYHWLSAVSQRRAPQTDGSELLKAHELLSLERHAFVYAVRSYNTNIARYAEIASPGRVGAGRLVAMLIHTDGNQNAARNDNPIRRTSAEEAVDSTASDPTQQTQGAEIPRNGGEHSILAQPKVQ